MGPRQTANETTRQALLKGAAIDIALTFSFYNILDMNWGGE